MPYSARRETTCTLTPPNSNRVTLGSARRLRRADSVGGVGMWSFVVALPPVQAEFGVARAEASLPYTLAMLGFGVGGVADGPARRPLRHRGAGRCSARSAWRSAISRVGPAPNIWQFALAHGLLIGFGCSATFGPLIADMSHWFARRRGIAVAIAASGNYLAGTIWPPIVQHFIDGDGWRATHIGIGMFCLVTHAAAGAAAAPAARRASSAATAGAAAAQLQRDARLSPQHIAGAALHRRRRLLRGDGDAAGAHRRLLRRSRLRRRRAAPRCCR